MNYEYEIWFKENEHFFDSKNKEEVYQKLENINNEQFFILKNEKFKDPKKTKLLSILFNGYDRIYLDEAAMGLFKFATMGCFGVLYLKDILSAYERTYAYNYIKAMEIIDFRDFGLNEIKKQQNKLLLNASVKLGKTIFKGAKDIAKSFTNFD